MYCCVDARILLTMYLRPIGRFFAAIKSDKKKKNTHTKTQKVNAATVATRRSFTKSRPFTNTQSVGRLAETPYVLEGQGLPSKVSLTYIYDSFHFNLFQPKLKNEKRKLKE